MLNTQWISVGLYDYYVSHCMESYCELATTLQQSQLSASSQMADKAQRQSEDLTGQVLHKRKEMSEMKLQLDSSLAAIAGECVYAVYWCHCMWVLLYSIAGNVCANYSLLFVINSEVGLLNTVHFILAIIIFFADELFAKSCKPQTAKFYSS